MDTSGTIHEIAQDDAVPESMVPVKGYPNPKCNDCYGRGYIRRIIQNITELWPQILDITKNIPKGVIYDRNEGAVVEIRRSVDCDGGNCIAGRA